MLGKILGVLVCLTALYMLYRNALEIGWLQGRAWNVGVR